MSQNVVGMPPTYWALIAAAWLAIAAGAACIILAAPAGITETLSPIQAVSPADLDNDAAQALDRLAAPTPAQQPRWNLALVQLGGTAILGGLLLGALASGLRLLSRVTAALESRRH